MKKTVVELFAGVGGFRVGLNNVTLTEDGVTKEEDNFEFVWANQWEPSTKIQHAFNCYEKRFGKSEAHSNQDITKVNKSDIPDHTLLVGGFPCQDYSVARTLSNEKGIEGVKGVLWWEINEIISVKKPPFVLLENVDRLLRSPSKQRGRDFGIMLKCFADNDYSVEWRVINAADYGHPQKRRRVFIFAYKNSTNYFNTKTKLTPLEIINTEGIFANEFPIIQNETCRTTSLDNYKSLVEVSDLFSFDFANSGYMSKGTVTTTKSIPVIGIVKPLIDILIPNNQQATYLSQTYIEKFRYLKGSKKIPRERNGFTYMYSEGNMPFPENLSSPGRTMLTSEGSVNRSTHVVIDPYTQKLRYLSPVECERLNEFPDNWTDVEMSDRKRCFTMGNALVCGIIKKIGRLIGEIIDQE